MKKVILIAMLFCLSFSPPIFADGFYWKTKVIDDNNTWTDPVPVLRKGRLNLRIHPDTSPDMTITLQSRYVGDTDWYDVDSWDIDSNSPDRIYTTDQPEPEAVMYKLGCKQGDYVSGNCTVRVGTGRVD